MECSLAYCRLTEYRKKTVIKSNEHFVFVQMRENRKLKKTTAAKIKARSKEKYIYKHVHFWLQRNRKIYDMTSTNQLKFPS